MVAARAERSCVAIVPAYLASSTLAATLASLIEGNADVVDRVVVVVSPGDDSAEVAGRFERVDVVTAPYRLSAGEARNRGRLLASNARVLLFVDADVSLPRGAVSRMIAALDARGLAAVGPRIRPAGPRVVGWLRHLLEFKDADRGAGAAWLVPSAALLCTAEAFDEVGGFVDMWPGEDLVFCFELGRGGFRVGRLDSVVAVHRHPPGLVVMLAHQYRLGASAVAARLSTGMRGVAFARRPLFAPLLLLGRAVRAALWLLRYRPAQIVVFVLLLPLYLAGLTAWTSGFVAGAHAYREPAT